MGEFVSTLLQIETLISVLVALAAFATVVTFAAPYFNNDKLPGRMKGVIDERERLKSAQRAMLNGSNDAKLRDKKKTIYNQLVDALNLKRVFETEPTRDALKQAGFRSEKHLVTFLAIRVIVPLIVAIVTFVYTSTVFADKVEPNMRIVASLIGLIFGYYMPNIGIKNLITRRQQSIKKAWNLRSSAWPRKLAVNQYRLRKK
jgi:tight adherence protein C